MTDPSPLLDACVALNLIASGVGLRALQTSSEPFDMSSEAAGETLWLDPETPGGDRELIDVDALVNDEQLSLVGLTDEESADYVEFAERVDDGEAATLAIARNRSRAVATDDRSARRLANTLDPPIALLGTSDIMRAWAERAGPTPNELADALAAIEQRAHYVPRRDDPNYEWWVSARGRQGGESEVPPGDASV